MTYERSEKYNKHTYYYYGSALRTSNVRYAHSVHAIDFNFQQIDIIVAIICEVEVQKIDKLGESKYDRVQSITKYIILKDRNQFYHTSEMRRCGVMIDRIG